MTKPHLIHSLTFAITQDGAAADGLALADWLRGVLLPVLDEVLEQHAPGQGVRRIARLEVDLGSVARQQADSELPRRLLAQLSAALGWSPEQATDASLVAAREQAHGESLLDYLRSGRLAWPLAADQHAAHRQLLLQVLASPQAPALLRAAVREPDMLTRLIRQFDAAELLQVAGVLNGQAGGAALASDAQEQGAPPASEAAWRRLLQQAAQRAGAPGAVYVGTPGAVHSGASGAVHVGTTSAIHAGAPGAVHVGVTIAIHADALPGAGASPPAAPPAGAPPLQLAAPDNAGGDRLVAGADGHRPPSTRIETAAHIEPSTSTEPAAHIETAAHIDPSTRIESSTYTEPAAHIEPPTRIEPSTHTEPATYIEPPTRVEPTARDIAVLPAGADAFSLTNFQDWTQQKLDLPDLQITLPELKQWLNWWLMHDVRLANHDCSLMLDAIDSRCHKAADAVHFMKLVLTSLRGGGPLDLEALSAQSEQPSAAADCPLAVDAIATLASPHALRNFINQQQQEDARLRNLNSAQLHQLVRAWILALQPKGGPSLLLAAVESHALKATSAHGFFRQVLQHLLDGDPIDFDLMREPAPPSLPNQSHWLRTAANGGATTDGAATADSGAATVGSGAATADNGAATVDSKAATADGAATADSGATIDTGAMVDSEAATADGVVTADSGVAVGSGAMDGNGVMVGNGAAVDGGVAPAGNAASARPERPDPAAPSPLPPMLQQSLPQRLANAMLQGDLAPLHLIWPEIVRFHADILRQAAQHYLRRADARERLIARTSTGMLRELLQAISAPASRLAGPLLQHSAQCNAVLEQPLPGQEFEQRVLRYALTQALDSPAPNWLAGLLQALSPTESGPGQYLLTAHAWRQILPANRDWDQALLGQTCLDAIAQALRQPADDSMADVLRSMLVAELCNRYPQLAGALLAEDDPSQADPARFSAAEWQALLQARLACVDAGAGEQVRQQLLDSLPAPAGALAEEQLQHAYAAAARMLAALPAAQPGPAQPSHVQPGHAQGATPPSPSLPPVLAMAPEAMLSILLLRAAPPDSSGNACIGLLLQRLLDAGAAGDAEPAGALESALSQPAAVERLVAGVPGPVLARLLVQLQPQLAAQLPAMLRAVADAVPVAPVPATQDSAIWRAIYLCAFVAADPVTPAEFIRSFVQRTTRRTDLPLPPVAASATPQELMRRLLQPLNAPPPAVGAAPAPHQGRAEAPVPENGESNIANAGLVIIATYAQRLFSLLELTLDGRFVSDEAAQRAVHLLQYAVTGAQETPEYLLALNKLLCGIDGDLPIVRGISITPHEQSTIEQLLQSVIAHWSALGNTSIAGLRETFLRRDGHLFFQDEAWHLKISRATFDMLLDRLPWSFALIRFPWMAHPLQVTWR